MEFSDFTQKSHRVIYGLASYSATWSAQIGNDRKETYTDYEKYYERIPYTVYEEKYNYSTKRTETVAVTKYRQEERQRAVLKERTVTDWNSGNGEHSDIVERFAGLDDMPNNGLARFLYDFSKIDENYISELSLDEIEKNPKMQITEATSKFVFDVHAPEIYRQLYSSLPGDHIKNVDYNITSYNQSKIQLIEAPEYSASIKYDGKEYKKVGFSFGNMTIGGDVIPNSVGIEEIKLQKQKATKEEINKRNEEIDDKVWNATSKISIVSIVLLLASIIVSAFVKFLAPVIICFICAIGMCTFSMTYSKKTKIEIQDITDIENIAAQKACDDECLNYEKTKKAEMLVLLNKKLSSLGLEPINDSEFLA